ncbi:hypothetical protein DFR46_1738 [Parasphingopyxis lamellibrachiae]|uniref:DUF1330 domain-containing protein n=2 Tax=Parasphingopyxis lamellibrachiae TaxID=680125 RepID=A0A3D9FFX0_9SPHN|nr:hypothetical protein DFR46_1738 [Parasphingopyxis lamellibrachiae]
MRILYFVLGWFALATSACAQENPPPENPVYYVGFNYFTGDGGLPESEVFSNYTAALEPIMARYGMTLETYRVVNGSADALPAHAITFGSAPDPESFGAFFADPEFQALFPSLVGIIDQHTVVFTREAFSLAGTTEADNILLSIGWIKEGADHHAAILARDAAISQSGTQYGLETLVHSQGMMANQGLADGGIEVPAPDYLEIWRVEDPHGLFDDPMYREAESEARNHMDRSASYWLQPWS